MAMRFHAVAGYDDQNRFVKMIYAGDDGEAAVTAYDDARKAAEFPRIGYVRNAQFSKRCSTEKAASPAEAAPKAPGAPDESLEGEEDEDGNDLVTLVAQAGRNKGKSK